MSDFVTRLAERAMGTAPVVQPLIAPMFAPEPPAHSMEPTPEDAHAPGSDPLPSPEDPAPHHLIEETRGLAHEEAGPRQEGRPTSVTPPSSAPDAAVPDPHPLAVPEPSRHSHTSEREDPNSPYTPAPTRRPRAVGVPGPLESGSASRQGDRQGPSSPGSRLSSSGETPELEVATERSPQDPSRTTIVSARVLPPHTRFKSIHADAPAPERRGVEEAPRRLVPEGSTPEPLASEDVPDRPPLLRSTMVLAERAQVTAEEPPQRDEGSLKDTFAGEDTPGADPVIVPRIVGHRPEKRQESRQSQSRVLAPEPPAPTIRVAIGRIEVRAITPPARKEMPVRPGPMLSLDDYLKQRNGGHR
jgi:hypothetical protein